MIYPSFLSFWGAFQVQALTELRRCVLYVETGRTEGRVLKWARVCQDQSPEMFFQSTQAFPET